jgi:predicted acylesterase/phospholipase RssA
MAAGLVKPLRVQLALQGGGARIFALVAALETFHKDFVETGKLQVTRISGTSAGAIVGGLYAAGVDINVIRTSLSSFPLESILSSFRQWGLRHFPKLVGASLIFRKKPIGSDAPLKRFLRDLLRQGYSFTSTRENNKVAIAPEKLKIEDLESRLPTILVAADITNRETVVFRSDGEGTGGFLVDCMLSSCAIPFFFRVPGSSEEPCS